MRLRFLSALFFLLIVNVLNAQTGCPGCTASVPVGLAADTIYLPKIPDGELGKPYDQDISFRMPKTTTPVHAIDSTTPPNLTISKIEILSLEGLPKGLKWQPNQTTFDVGSLTDGCIKICGTPIESDTFVLTVKIKATVFVISQESSFPMRIYIAPKQSTAGAFSMNKVEGCGSVTVDFTNNIPSKGQSGFTYEWDFGDGTTVSKEEKPAPHTYTKPGIYVVKYKAKIDTAETVLKSVTVFKVECVDQLGLGQPDLYMFINDSSATKVFDSSPSVNNANLPHTFLVNLTLGTGDYQIQLIDEDGGLKGGDDDCGKVTFNAQSQNPLISGGLTVELDIEKKVEEIISQDTIIVYPNPDKPVVTAPNGFTECGTANTVLLKSNSTANNQWLLSGQPIAGAMANTYDPSKSGQYAVLATNEFGCKALSDSVFVGIYPKPASPIYININNLLVVKDSLGFPSAQYALQWYKDNDPIPGATDYRYCTKSSGSYGVEVTDLITKCTSYYGATVAFNPNVANCFSSTGEAAYVPLGIFPNPAHDEVQVRLIEQLPVTASLRLWDTAGRLVRTASLSVGTDSFSVDCSDLPNGVFTLEVLAPGVWALGKVVVVH